MEKESYGINYIELDEENLKSLMQEIQMPCFGYDKKMIVIKNSGIFKKDTAKRKANDIKEIRENLESYLKENIEELKQRLILIFIEDKVESLKITKTIENIGGIICEFALLKPMEIEKRLNAFCKAYQVNAENGSMKLLIETSGTSMQDLINEFRKLVEYVRRKWNYN